MSRLDESHDTLAGWFREIPPAKDGKPGKYCMLGTAYWRIVKKSRAGAKADITFTSSETAEDVTLQVYSPWDIYASQGLLAYRCGASGRICFRGGAW
uniref:Uncharacterized protein n=1 Tax=Chromera velia CCMP2878 TaxID=1169474 RepID=A0A0G4FKL4_9ALVE|eukprot:Cvel_415.t1-p1 / transcript=Cvel_415.t1 / gene=Cvel_415 / organism=Chromera_velia_CCMP2878 / gene_product=hypothetical protein / transcript_product=hypothetical protein / location=Cvel_scaffold13:142395-142682(+) / protein_length=96 / sequence_SO=supercontig / SO=protein_coding / is_pseudo=false